MHIHSDNSSDGESSVIEECESAVSAHLKHIAITDHCDIDLYEKENCGLALRQSYFDILKARSVFEGCINIIHGVELGNCYYDPLAAEAVTSRFPYDFVLGSIHSVSGYDDFAFIDFKKVSADELVKLYLNELEGMIEWGGFDVLAHLTYPLRYINGIYKMELDFKKYQEQVETIIKKVVKKNKGLEINTSGLRQPYGMTMPDIWCLKLYFEAGGEILTMGSDAHRAADIGANIMDAVKLAKQAGFKYYSVFKKRHPVFIKIEI